MNAWSVARLVFDGFLRVRNCLTHGKSAMLGNSAILRKNFGDG